MIVLNKRCVNYLLSAALLLCISTWVNSDDSGSPDLEPDPKYSPADVVSIQMNALKQNDTPFKNAGIETTFRFASPSNKAQTGPLERFKALFTNTAYTPMLNHKSMQIGPVDMSERTANIPIIIEDENNLKIGYIFTLDKQNEAP